MWACVMARFSSYVYNYTLKNSLMALRSNSIKGMLLVSKGSMVSNAWSANDVINYAYTSTASVSIRIGWLVAMDKSA